MHDFPSEMVIVIVIVKVIQVEATAMKLLSFYPSILPSRT